MWAYSAEFGARPEVGVLGGGGGDGVGGEGVGEHLRSEITVILLYFTVV